MVHVISLSNEAYAELSRRKHGSFSDTVLTLIRDNSSKGTDYDRFEKLIGAFSEDREYWEKAKKEIYERRKKIKVREW